MAKPRNFPCRRLAVPMAAAAALLQGCVSKPYPTAVVQQQQISSQAQRVPMRVWNSTDPMLACVGDQLRDARIAPLLVSWSVTDTTGRTNVDQGSLIRSGLHKMAVRGANFQVTSMGAPPPAPTQGMHLSTEERLRALKPGPANELATPDIIVEGGVISVTSATQFRQRSGGFSARDVDGGVSTSTSYDTAVVSYTIKRFGSGIDVTGATVTLKVVYQQGTASNDLGGYVAYRQDGNQHGAGVRIGVSDGFNESAEDALSVAVETALAILFTEFAGADLSACPAQVPPADPNKIDGPPVHNQVATFFEKMEEGDRIRFLQASLAARNYDPGAIDGKVGPQTRSAIALFERDTGVPPSGGRVGLPLLAAVAQARIARGEDIRQPPRNWGSSGESVRIVPNVSYGSYFVGQRLRAQVVSPRAGHMTCLLASPDGGTVSLYPLVDNRPTAVSARAPLLLPAATDGPGQPKVTLKQVGSHALYCALTRTELSARLPASLRPGADGRGVQLVDAQTAIRRSAGSDWIADGLATFEVAQVTTR